MRVGVFKSRAGAPPGCCTRYRKTCSVSGDAAGGRAEPGRAALGHKRKAAPPAGGGHNASPALAVNVGRVCISMQGLTEGGAPIYAPPKVAPKPAVRAGPPRTGAKPFFRLP